LIRGNHFLLPHRSPRDHVDACPVWFANRTVLAVLAHTFLLRDVLGIASGSRITQITAIQPNRRVSLRPLSFADYLFERVERARGRAQGPEIR
jgi:hypothetical protein